MNLRRIHPIRSGVEAYIAGLVTALARRSDVTVHGVVPGVTLPLPAGVERLVEPLGAAANVRAKVWYDFARAGKAAGRSPATVYHGVDTFLPAALPRHMTRVVNVHDLGYVHHPHLFDRRTLWLNQWHARIRLRRADHYIALSVSTADDLVNLLGIESRRITVVPAAHDTFFAVDDADTLDGPPFFLAVGGSNPRKNLDRVLTAFRRWQVLGGARSRIQLRVAGGVDGSTQAQAHEHLGHDVVFEGFVTRERLRTLYRNTQGLLFPALHEGFGIPILEAMACGAPVLTTGTGATSEVGQDAIVPVDPVDTESIARGIDVLHSQGAELRLAGLQRARQFSWERSAAMTVDVYDRLAR